PRRRGGPVGPGGRGTPPDDDGRASRGRREYAGNVSVASRSPTSGTADSRAPSYGAGWASTSERQPSATMRGSITRNARFTPTAATAQRRARRSSPGSNRLPGSMSPSRADVTSTRASTSTRDGAPGRGG